jgi:murein DD-endopeptidase MepM/ murein hydrolase activator NlpD
MLHRLLSVRVFDPKNKSNIISARLRPLFEHQSAKNILGLPLLILTLLSGALNTPLLLAMGVVPANIEAYYQPYERIETNMITKPAINYPVANALGVSQGFHVFHPGVDIRAPLGSDIKPIADGVVTKVAFETFGYGHRVEVTHENGAESLYAHMDKVLVSVGDKVTTNDTVGTVGLTGHTTGPHLHLEIRKEGRVINPVTYLAR